MLRRNRKSEKGQAMVEFALILPLIILIFALIVDFGWIFMNTVIANNACRDVTRYLSINYETMAISKTKTQIETAATTYAKLDSNQFKNKQVTITPPAVSGEKFIGVTLQGEIDILTPLDNLYGVTILTTTIDGGIIYKTTCTMKIE